MIHKERGIYNAFFRQFLFILLLITIGVIIEIKLGYLLGSFLGAITIYVLLRIPLFYLTEKRRWKSWIASLTLLMATLIVLFAVVFFVFKLVASEVPSLDTSIIVGGLTQLINKINDFLGYQLISKEVIMESNGIFTNIVSGVLNTTYSFAINFLLMIFILYFLLESGHKVEQKVKLYSPFSGVSFEMIKREVKDIIFGNALGIPVVMLVQGIAAAIGYWITGVDNVFFWAFITAIFGLIPVVGTAAIWLPVGVYLILIGNIWQGIVLILYGVIIISNIDNVARMVLMNKMSHTHPLIVIFGVILGIPLFGFWGIIFGPLLISGFLLLIKIYLMEYGKKK